MLLPALAAGCSSQQEDTAEVYAVGDTNTGGLTKDGYYYVADAENEDGLLHYYDFASGQSVPVCNKAECAHRAVDTATGEKASCNAQIEAIDFVVYEGKIYYTVLGDDGNLILRCRDQDGDNDKKVAVLQAFMPVGRSWYYGGHAFIMASTDVSQSFDPGTGESEESVMRFFAVDLKSGKAAVIGESSLSADNHAFWVYRMEAGKVCYHDREKDKWYVYDTAEEKQTEQTEIPSGALIKKTGEYLDIYGQYAYTFADNADGSFSVMQLNWETGEEQTLYRGEPGNVVGYYMCGMDRLAVSELYEEKEKIQLYDMDKGEMKEVPEAFYEQSGGRVSFFDGDENGLVYEVVGQPTEEHEAELETRYATWEDIFAGNGKSQLMRSGSIEVW